MFYIADQNVDGAQLRRVKRNPRHIICTGVHDEQAFTEVDKRIGHDEYMIGRSQLFSIPPNEWERIFINGNK